MIRIGINQIALVFLLLYINTVSIYELNTLNFMVITIQHFVEKKQINPNYHQNYYLNRLSS